MLEDVFMLVGWAPPSAKDGQGGRPTGHVAAGLVVGARPVRPLARPCLRGCKRETGR